MRKHSSLALAALAGAAAMAADDAPLTLTSVTRGNEPRYYRYVERKYIDLQLGLMKRLRHSNEQIRQSRHDGAGKEVIAHLKSERTALSRAHSQISQHIELVELEQAQHDGDTYQAWYQVWLSH